MVEGSERRPYLFWCAQEHLDFRLPEFEALARVFGIRLDWVETVSEKPWIIINFESESDALKILSRSICTKYCIQLWGEGKDLAQLQSNLVYDTSELNQKTFKIYIDAFMKKLSFEERLSKIEDFAFLPLDGMTVDLKRPELVLSCFEFYDMDHNNLPPAPTRIFFGRCIGEGSRHLITKLSVKNRKFIGNTTMDAQLSLLMANVGCVCPGDVVLDPFVGTGSLLVACAQFGGYVLGGDIDYLMLHARTRPSRVGAKKRAQDESMRANFEQYGLADRYLDVVACDSSRPPWVARRGLDAIVTDPPYGIRESIEKIGSGRDDVAPIPKEYLPYHVPQKVAYQIEAVFEDLVKFAAHSLKKSGRLVFWIPEQDRERGAVPSHPELVVVAECEQILSSRTSRRLVVMEKI